jgi:hypothetical protein
MKPSLVLNCVVPLVLQATRVYSQDCGIPGIVGGECVIYYGGSGCYSPMLGSFRPTCQGNCFQFNSFGSVSVAGDGFSGTDCVLYSDINCQDEIIGGDTGNEVSRGGTVNCLSVNNGGVAQSMQCYFGC